MFINYLVMFEATVSIAVGVAEFYGVGAARGRSEGDNDYLLHIGVYHGVVNKATHIIENGNVHIAEALVEADVDGFFAGTSYNGVGINAQHQAAFQINFIIPLWRVC